MIISHLAPGEDKRSFPVGDDFDLAAAEDHFRALDINGSGLLARPQVEALGEWAWRHFHPTGAPLKPSERQKLGSKLLKTKQYLSMTDFLAWYMHVRGQVAARRSAQQQPTRSTPAPQPQHLSPQQVQAPLVFEHRSSPSYGAPGQVQPGSALPQPQYMGMGFSPLDQNSNLMVANDDLRSQLLAERERAIAARLQDEADAAIQAQRISDLENQMLADGARNEKILKRLQHENEKLEKKYADAHNQINILQQRIADDANQRARDRAKADERLADKEHKLQEVLKEARLYQEQMSEAMKAPRTPDKHKDTMMAQQEQILSQKERIAYLEDKVSSLQKELEHSVQERRTAKEDLSVALQDARELRDEMNEAQTAVLKANSLRQQTALELAKAHDQITNMRKEHTEMLARERVLADMRPRNDPSMHQSMLEKDIEIDNLQAELALAKKDIFMLQSSQEGSSMSQEAELDELRAKIKVLRESVVNSDRDMDRMKAELEHEIERNHTGSAALDRLRTENEDLMRKLSHLEMRVLQKERECDRLKQEAMEASAQLDVLSTSTSGPSQQERVLQNKLKNLLEAASQDRSDFEHEIAVRDAKIDELQVRLQAGRRSVM